MKTIELFGGEHIREAVAKAVALAIKDGEAVQFQFNGKTYTVQPDDSYATAKARAEDVLGHPILTADEESARAAADLERQAHEWADAIAAAGVATEAQMRATEVPWLKTPEDLATYIAALVDRPHDYGTCVYAMSMAAVAAYHYVASRLGVTGFQASCADLDVLRRTRRMDNRPFIILDGRDMLYPQSDLQGKLAQFLNDHRGWAAEQAKKEIAEASPHVHPDVRAHWEQLASQS